jgi:hypothetical protein
MGRGDGVSFAERLPQTLAEQLDFLRRDRASGRLTVASRDGQRGLIAFYMGVPLYAEAAAVKGDAALEAMRGWDGASWKLEATARLPTALNVSGAFEAMKSAGQGALKRPALRKWDPWQFGVSRVEPVVLRPSGPKLCYLLFLAVASIASLALLPRALDTSAETVTWPIFIGLISPGLAAIGAYVLVLAWRWRLVLDSYGFTVYAAMTRKQVAWADVTSFAEGWRGKGFNRVVTFRYRSEIYSRNLPRNALDFLRFMLKVNGEYVPLFGLSVGAQIDLLETWRRRWGVPDSSAAS